MKLKDNVKMTGIGIFDGKLSLIISERTGFMWFVEIFKDKKGMLRFHLKARNGEIIAASESYAKMESCLMGIEIIRKYALDARIVKET